MQKNDNSIGMFETILVVLALVMYIILNRLSDDDSGMTEYFTLARPRHYLKTHVPTNTLVPPGVSPEQFARSGFATDMDILGKERVKEWYDIRAPDAFVKRDV